MSAAMRFLFSGLWVACLAGGAVAAMQTHLAVNWLGLACVCFAGLALSLYDTARPALARRAVDPGRPPRKARFRNLPYR